MSPARSLCFALAALSLAGIARELHHATDFPTAAPVSVVDAGLVRRLRGQPGMHLALTPDARFEVALGLVDDADNRRFYGTSIDQREPVPERAIHVQRLGDRGAIHADLYNPRAGFFAAFMHGVVEVPIIPLGLAGLSFVVAGLRRR